MLSLLTSWTLTYHSEEYYHKLKEDIRKLGQITKFARQFSDIFFQLMENKICVKDILIFALIFMYLRDLRELYSLILRLKGGYDQN